MRAERSRGLSLMRINTRMRARAVVRLRWLPWSVQESLSANEGGEGLLDDWLAPAGGLEKKKKMRGVTTLSVFNLYCGRSTYLYSLCWTVRIE